MARITNRLKRVFIFAEVPDQDDPTDKTKAMPAVVANPGETVTVPNAHLALLRKHSEAIFNRLFDGRHLIETKGKGDQLREDELANPKPVQAPDELAIDPNPAENVTLERKSLDTVEVQLDGPTEAPAPATRSRKA